MMSMPMVVYLEEFHIVHRLFHHWVICSHFYTGSNKNQQCWHNHVHNCQCLRCIHSHLMRNVPSLSTVHNSKFRMKYMCVNVLIIYVKWNVHNNHFIYVILIFNSISAAPLPQKYAKVAALYFWCITMCVVTLLAPIIVHISLSYRESSLFLLNTQLGLDINLCVKGNTALKPWITCTCNVPFINRKVRVEHAKKQK